MAAPAVPLAPPALEALVVAALTADGVPEADARRAAQILVLADLFGLTTHGVARVESYAGRIALGGVAARPAIVTTRLAPALALIDGANGLGPLVGMAALDAAMDGARECGVGVAFARASNHFGPCAPYNYLAAQQGFASIVASNASTTIAPFGGKGARLGNNPVGFGVPRPGGDPIILDMALSVAARAKIRAAAQRGDPIPVGWATDADGRPTTDARAALAGFLAPMAGHKGYGLAVMIDLFAGLLSGASFLTHVKSWQDEPGEPQDLGHLFILIDAKRLAPADTLAERLADFAAILHDTPAADPARPVMLPGEREMAAFHRQSREGMSLDANVVARLKARAERGPPA